MPDRGIRHLETRPKKSLFSTVTVSWLLRVPKYLRRLDSFKPAALQIPLAFILQSDRRIFTAYCRMTIYIGPRSDLGERVLRFLGASVGRCIPSQLVSQFESSKGSHGYYFAHSNIKGACLNRHSNLQGKGV